MTANDIHPSVASDLPVAVIGAGPIGLAAAAHLLERGQTPLVLEAGASVAASIRDWRHVRLFSPWCLDIDGVAAGLLTSRGWTAPPPDALPTGGDLVDRYLEPLGQHPAIAARLRTGHRVVAIARHGMDKVRTPGRDARPFVLRVTTADDDQCELLARAVIDASGTWTTPSPLGAAGLPALGEHAARDHVVPALPDVGGADRQRFAGRRTIVIGAGHSAATTLLALADLQDQAPGTDIVWAVRSDTPRPLVGRGTDDELPARGRLGVELSDLIASRRVELVTGFRTLALERHDGEVILTDLDGDRRITAHVVVNATGFRPDHSIAGELRLRLDPALDSAADLAPLIDPNVHDCGSVPPHGARHLAHPEPGYWIVGTKSYGRAPTFLLATGYEQVRSVVAAVAGDHGTADEIRDVLPIGGGCPAHPPGSDPDAACTGGTRISTVAA